MRAGARLPVFLCAVSAWAAPLAAAAAPADPAPRVLYYRGLYEEIARGDLEAAIAAYRRLRDGLPPGNELSSEALIREGICLEKMGRDEEALSCYDQAISQSPDSAAVVEKAFSEMAVFFSRPAMVHARDKEIDALREEAARCIEKGDHAGARDLFRRSLLIDPDNHALQLKMAASCTQLGNHREAAFYYALAAGSEQLRNDPRFLRELTDCHRALGEYDPAIKLWRAYLAGEAPGERQRKLASWEIELLLEADEGADQDPPPPALAELLAAGETRSRAENYKEAVAVYAKAGRRFPGSYLPPLRLGVLCDYLLEDDGRFAWTVVLGRGYRQGGREEVAASFYERTIDKAPLVTAQRLRCRLAVLYESLGDLEKAAYHMAQYFSRNVRPVENDGVLADRIRKKRMRDRIRRMREKE